MNNPFIITGKYVAPEYFCDREEETAQLVSNVQNWRNTVLVSLRRMGKSGLISHLYAQSQIKDDYETFFIDVFDTASIEELVLLLSKEITSKLQPKGMRLVEKFISIVNSLKFSYSPDPITGVPSLELSMGQLENPAKTLEQLFEFLEASEKPCIVAIDEFQQIAEYPNGKKTIATLRTFVQKCTKTCFIFAGSNRRMMSHLFTSPSEPFFMSCTPLYLDAIDKSKYTEFVTGHFVEKGKGIQPECVEYVYDKFSGHTWFVQYVFNRLYEMTQPNEVATIENANEAIVYILDIHGHSFQEMFVRMSERQRALLIAISKEGKVSAPTGALFVNKHNLKSASAVQGALKPLLEDETISFIDGEYIITNRFFSLWLAKRY